MKIPCVAESIGKNHDFKLYKDIVELSTKLSQQNKWKRNDSLRLQRDMKIAVGEYAPNHRSLQMV